MRLPILVVTFAALAASAHAVGRCNEPYAPTIKLASDATKQDVNSLRGDTQAFIAASDLYQKCLLEKGASEGSLHTNQALKQKIGAEFNTVLRAYQVAHPGA